MLVPDGKYKKAWLALVAVCVILLSLFFAGPLLAEETESNEVNSTSPLVESTPADPAVINQDALNGLMEPDAIAQPPARYGGTVKFTNGDPVDWDEIAGYIDLDESGAIESDEIPNPDHNKLLKGESGNYTIGQYGLPLNDHYYVRQLLVNCPEDTPCSGKPVYFRVKVGGVTYNATTNPTTVKWAGGLNSSTNVDLTISATPATGIKGTVILDSSDDRSGTMVRVKQGSATITTRFTDATGKYEVTGLSAGNYTLEFSNTSGSWKRVTKSAAVGTSGLTTVDVTLYLGDVNQDAAINFSDLLWLSRRIGATPGHTLWADLGDINNDNVINILDLLRLNQNIGK